MAGPDPADAAATVDDLAEILRDPGDARRRLPAVVGLFDADDERLRLAAAWTCCHVAAAHEDVVEYLVRRLSARAREYPDHVEVRLALSYLASRFPDRTEDALAAAGAETADSDDRPPRTAGLGDPVEGVAPGPSRSRYDDVGRTRAPTGRPDDPRRTYASQADGRDGPGERRPRDGETTGDAASNEPENEEAAEHGPEGGYMGTQREASRRRTRDVTPVAARSRFDELHVVAQPEQGRYARRYEALVGESGEETAVTFRLLRRPDLGQRPAFERGIGRELRRWAGLDDHPNLVGVLDWGVDPRPWLVTPAAGDALSERGRSDVDRALRDAGRLADAVAHLHRGDAVHGAIDPDNVVYPTGGFDAPESEEDRDDPPDGPRLDNVGLLHVYRDYVDPAGCLDPRYAAPEYFERRFGRVDHQTDVYGLGATIYRLLTGEPPYDGRFEAVRDQVLNDSPPVPSEAIDDPLPPGLDDLVARALATRKLQRFETVEHLRRALWDLAPGGPDGG